MEQNEELNEEINEYQEEEVVSEYSSVLDFVELVRCVSEYYNVPNGDDFEGDDWKFKTGQRKRSNVPNGINKLVEKAFRVQLKKFTY